jgi:ribosomal RNA assembly protein
MKEVLVPEDRVAVVIGEDGETREDIERMTECDLKVEDNLVRIEGDAYDELQAQNVVKAIGRGFNPEKAMRLVERETGLHVLDVSEYDSSRSRQNELKGRVIGRDGETRRHIENEADVELSVYGSTVGIIGKMSNVQVARQAIEMLLNGASHATAYNYLEKNQAKIKR